MNEQNIYRKIVSDPAPFKRTEGDFLSKIDKNRIKTSRFLEVALHKEDIPGIQKPSLISSYEGKIEEILFVFPSYFVRISKYADAYKSVLKALSESTKVVIVHQPSTLDIIENWISSIGNHLSVKYVPVPEYINLTDWAEDAYVGMKDAEDNSHFLMEPWEFLRGGDALIADYVSQFTDTNISQSPLIFQGGNCLIGNDFWLLGKDYYIDSINLLKDGRPPIALPKKPNYEKIVTKLFSDYLDKDRELIIIGTEKQIPYRTYNGIKYNDTFYLDVLGGMGPFQPIFHIDMFISLVGTEGGKFVAMVGSPDLGAEILGQPSLHSFQYTYDSIAEELENKGFEIIRNPLVHYLKETGNTTIKKLKEYSQGDGGHVLLPAIQELELAGINDNDSILIREMHHITWNNCLVENNNDEKFVYLPTFGHGDYSHLSVIDNYMEELWEKCGFKVKLLGDFNPFAERQGVVHCISKYLKRKVTVPKIL